MHVFLGTALAASPKFDILYFHDHSILNTFSFPFWLLYQCMSYLEVCIFKFSNIQVILSYLLLLLCGFFFFLMYV